MKDLFIYTADTDALAVMQGLLSRSRALKLRTLTYTVDRNTGRDAGMVKQGPELVRMRVRRDEFSRVLLLWDHVGSGWERKTPGEARQAIQTRLNQVTWEGRSDAIVVVPEIEEWLWHSPASVAAQFRVSVARVEELADEYSARKGLDVAACKSQFPKELFEHVLYRCQRRGPLPKDFEAIAKGANLDSWVASDSFAEFVRALRAWFAE